MNDYKKVAEEVATLVTEKNEAYGDSFRQSVSFLKLLYPDGIDPKDYKNVLIITRIWDKIKRIATDKDAFGENPFRDIMGYSLLAVTQELDNKSKTEGVIK